MSIFQEMNMKSSGGGWNLKTSGLKMKTSGRIGG